MLQLIQKNMNDIVKQNSLNAIVTFKVTSNLLYGDNLKVAITQP